MEASILTDLHRAAGAEFAAGVEPPLCLTYGDVPAEYEAASAGAVLFDQTDRGLVVVRGDERALFLHRVLANRVRELEPGQGDRNLLLSSKGKVMHAFELAVEPEEIRLTTPPGDAARLMAALDVYLFTEDVALSDETAASAPVAIAGPDAEALLERALGFAGGLADQATATFEHAGHSLRATAVAVAGSPGFRIDGGPEAAAALWRALTDAGAQPAARVVWDILRVEAGAAEPGVDVDDTIYPQEARLEAAFSLDKGCYIGQEVVAKIDTYGGLNKRLVGLRVDHDEPVPPGSRLYKADPDGGERRDLGLVTSWAYSFVLDTGLVLAYVKRKHQVPGTVFELGDGEGRATIVPLPVRTGALAVGEEAEPL